MRTRGQRPACGVPMGQSGGSGGKRDYAVVVLMPFLLTLPFCAGALLCSLISVRPCDSGAPTVQEEDHGPGPCKNMVGRDLN